METPAVLEPLNSTVAVSLMKALAGAGNRPGALQFAAVHESLVRDELGVPPDPAVVSLVEELRREQAAIKAPDHERMNAGADLAPRLDVGTGLVNQREVRAVEAHPGREPQSPQPGPLIAAGTPDIGSSRERSLMQHAQSVRGSGAIILAVVVLVAAVVWYSRSSASPVGARIDASAVAVIPFSYHGDSASAYLREGAVELMSANLDGAGDLRSVNPRALLSYARESPSGSNSVEAGDSIARHFNANFFLLGDIAEAAGKLLASPGLCTSERHSFTSFARAAVDGQSSSLFSVLDGLTTELLAERYNGPARASDPDSGTDNLFGACLEGPPSRRGDVS